MIYLSQIVSLFLLVLLQSCATKYVIPGNRFLTPETQGEAFRGQFEFLQTSGNQLMINTYDGNVESGVFYSETNRTGFIFHNSLLDEFDFFWSHIGSGNSMIGGKFQVVGGSKLTRSTGHKLALAAAIGGNEHETDDKSVEFELTGNELMLLYGYRISPFVLPYSSFSYANYKFSGELKSADPVLNGLKPSIKNKIYSLSAGLEFNYFAFMLKVESTYQQIETSKTKDKNRLIFGYTLGFNW